MWRSLQAQGGREDQWWALCLDDSSYHCLRELELPGVHVLSLEEVEAATPGLRGCRTDRSLVEYYFTLSPILPLYVMDHHPEVELVTYLDADLFFYAPPEPLYAEFGQSSVGMIEHRFAPGRQDHERYGVFNVGWVTFRNDALAREVLHWWRTQCMEHCKDAAENGKFADQKYLDDWPRRFPGVKVLSHFGANVAPWNLATHRLAWDERSQSVLVDGQPLLFYHFHDMQVHCGRFWELPGRYWVRHSSRILKKRIYDPYVVAWRRQQDALPPTFQARRAAAAAERSNNALRRGGFWRQVSRLTRLALQGRLIWR